MAAARSMQALSGHMHASSSMGRTAAFASRTSTRTGMSSAIKRLTISRPVPPVAPATSARNSENCDEAAGSSGRSRDTTSPSAGVRSSGGPPNVAGEGGVCSWTQG